MDSMNDNKHTMSDLYQMQSLPLNAKIQQIFKDKRNTP